ncbi:hypothetical protein MYCTH_2124179 [Thermothelomyces thermophilus ATCC 42464]|uniref:Uncharacterized protein n=1 Tax=Thermothelomyces thermophilus (strain ATCC 42464 / BCRC 31852 / DSM 1799) TaxID=573729 RepID=G2Q3I0_THET4|nr:uncharacterized protein MYCTH_2124179 [Thermothelomyces thermophilus ATCC 42464]AEO55240.1 hypothetical protein MYCTH_2124179 [Thermothelomyces thermophilus ATCC 42464]
MAWDRGILNRAREQQYLGRGISYDRDAASLKVPGRWDPLARPAARRGGRKATGSNPPAASGVWGAAEPRVIRETRAEEAREVTLSPVKMFAAHVRAADDT